MPPPLVSHDPQPPTLRFFYGLVPDAAAAQRLARSASALARACGGRALAAPDLHLTLAFVGNRAAGDRALLTPPALALPAALVARVDWPAMQLDRLASFGHGIVWAGPARTPPWLADLASTLRASLRAGGIDCDEQPMRAHVTLVRGARRWHDPALRPAFAPVAVSSWRLALGWSGDAPAGARYRWQAL